MYTRTFVHIYICMYRVLFSAFVVLCILTCGCDYALKSVCIFGCMHHRYAKTHCFACCHLVCLYVYALYLCVFVHYACSTPVAVHVVVPLYLYPVYVYISTEPYLHISGIARGSCPCASSYFHICAIFTSAHAHIFRTLNLYAFRS